MLLGAFLPGYEVTYLDPLLAKRDGERGDEHLPAVTRRHHPHAAVQDLSKALSAEPKMAAARFNRGLAYLQIGQPSRAETDFTNLIRTNGRDAESYLYRGQARAALKKSSAAADFDKAISLNEDWGLAWFIRGRYRDGIGDREGANADFLRAYELGHSDPWLLERVRDISG